MPVVKSGTDALRVRAIGTQIVVANTNTASRNLDPRDYEKGLSVGTGLVIDGNQHQATISFSADFTLDLLNSLFIIISFNSNMGTVLTIPK